MTERFPDLEIYLLKPDTTAIKQWLAAQLPGQLEEVKVTSGHCHWRAVDGGNRMDIFLNENAEKNFASLWFKQNLSPWNNDLECARSAHAALGTEIRCSDSSWQEDENEDSAGWIKLIRGEEKPVSW